MEPMTPPPARWLCRTCGQTFTAWRTAKRHADEHHGDRLDVVLPEANR